MLGTLVYIFSLSKGITTRSQSLHHDDVYEMIRWELLYDSLSSTLEISFSEPMDLKKRLKYR